MCTESEGVLGGMLCMKNECRGATRRTKNIGCEVEEGYGAKVLITRVAVTVSLRRPVNRRSLTVRERVSHHLSFSYVSNGDRRHAMKVECATSVHSADT